MNVLSLFDGISCAQVALERAGIHVDTYYASEVDKYAMKVTQKNYPDTVQLGSVEFVTKETFGNHKIDLLIGGSPCQGFSFAGGQLNFQDERSRLFFDFYRLKKKLKPKYFLLENVPMNQRSMDVISDMLGVLPVLINSSQVSAQNRRRLYWTNIPNFVHPDDKGILLKDILIDDMADEKPVKMTQRNWETLKTRNEKAVSMSASMWRGAGNNGTTLIEVVDGKVRHPEATEIGYAEAAPGEGLDLTHPKSFTRRGRLMKYKSNCLTVSGHSMGVVTKDIKWRKLTVIECERLQTLPDNYTDAGISNTQRYKALGNAFTVDVIAHILKQIKIDMDNLISYKPRIENRPILKALRALAKKNKVKTNRYIETVFLKHLEEEGVTWNQRGTLKFDKKK